MFHKSLATHRKDILGFDNTILRVLNFFLQAAEPLMNEEWERRGEIFIRGVCTAYKYRGDLIVLKSSKFSVLSCSHFDESVR